MGIRIKIKRSLDEVNAMSAGGVEGYSGPFGDPETVDTFNKKQERDQRLRGSKLIEMFSSSGLSGRNKQQIVSGEEEFAGHRERSLQQGLQNFKEGKKKRTFKVKISRNPRK